VVVPAGEGLAGEITAVDAALVECGRALDDLDMTEEGRLNVTPVEILKIEEGVERLGRRVVVFLLLNVLMTLPLPWSLVSN
jgi:hypothetical protein